MQFGRFDIGGQWCLSQISPDALRTLLARIRSIETMTITEAFNNRDEPGKDYSIADLPSREAWERLVELEYDDEEPGAAGGGGAATVGGDVLDAGPARRVPGHGHR